MRPHQHCSGNLSCKYTVVKSAVGYPCRRSCKGCPNHGLLLLCLPARSAECQRQLMVSCYYKIALPSELPEKMEVFLPPARSLEYWSLRTAGLFKQSEGTCASLFPETGSVNLQGYSRRNIRYYAPPCSGTVLVFSNTHSHKAMIIRAPLKNPVLSHIVLFSKKRTLFTTLLLPFEFEKAVAFQGLPQDAPDTENPPLVSSSSPGQWLAVTPSLPCKSR